MSERQPSALEGRNAIQQYRMSPEALLSSPLQPTNVIGTCPHRRGSCLAPRADGGRGESAVLYYTSLGQSSELKDKERDTEEKLTEVEKGGVGVGCNTRKVQEDVKFKSKLMVTSLIEVNVSIAVRQQTVPINSHMLLMRILCVVSYKIYELAPKHPFSDNISM
ncbi:hypothetical protein PR048_028126 [Dryococelus australis]|uniref:Uncharacterized protein n=1 Tax=Dryococelus australis TaxID=614101 RepID=A0ABQ9GIE3_9NEOP|nr:hypothetical protein PR048_028126 [Dryococelus australis]